jgi:cold shock CspA family protein
VHESCRTTVTLHVRLGTFLEQLVDMQTPPTISYVGFDPEPDLRALVERHLRDLERYHPRITTGRVSVEAPHHRHQTGTKWHVHIEIRVPGDDLVVDHEREIEKRHEDPAAAVRDAFKAIRRKLQDHARRMDGRIKAHPSQARARVSQVFPGEGYGFLRTDDDRDVYFHAHSVLGARLEDLAVGQAVIFVEEAGERGPQASTVRTA